MNAPGILRVGETCWRMAPSRRVAFLVDGQAFFAAVADALERARESIWLLGWDFHSAALLRPDRAESPRSRLLGLLESLLEARPGLRVHLLGWDFSLIFAIERELRPLLERSARRHRSLHFARDGAHPLTGCQHQKLVVVDDAVAFVGGFDLTTHRWDTREHRPDDPRRVTPAGTPYQPFHDVQMCVDGEAAAALGQLARERWQRATGHQVSASRTRSDPWPLGLEPQVRDVAIGIARTAPCYDGELEVREVEALYRASIAAARHWIYSENQYLSSERIGDWLCERLREPRGPEIVILGPRRNSGWLEQNTMGALRARIVRRLRQADRHARLRVLYPHVDGLPGDQFLNVHSKVMVVDDEFVRVGSSNLSSRSLGLDSECDLAFEAGGREPLQRAIAGFRDGLVAEHLGVTAGEVAERLAATGSLIATIDQLGGRSRTLRALEIDAGDWQAETVAALGAVDLGHPLPLEELVERVATDDDSGAPAGLRSLMGLGVVLLGIALAALAWRWAPLDSAELAAALVLFRNTWYGVIAACGLFALACLLFAPVTALTVAAALALGPWIGALVAWLGSIAAAGLGYLAGRVLWRGSVRRLAGRRVVALSERLGRHGVLSSALLRTVPVAPFMVVNVVAGASHVSARDFMLGTALGMLPGALVLAIAASQLKAWVGDPGVLTGLGAALALLVLVVAAALVRRRARPKRSAAAPRP